MTIIYATAGRAQEYCSLAVNLYKGCGHGCKYCYAPLATRVDREKFYKEPAPRQGVIESLAKQVSKRAKANVGQYTIGDDAGATVGINDSSGPVLLCFTCDPYQPINEVHGLAGKAIKILKAGNINIEILTKGGARAEADYNLLAPGDKVGATLTFIHNDDSLEWEPGAALPGERFRMLQAAKARGLQTWASLEPVIDPGQTLEIIKATCGYVDLYKVGTMNHHPHAKTIDWSKFASDVVSTLKKHDCNYYIKKDLAAYVKKT